VPDYVCFFEVKSRFFHTTCINYGDHVLVGHITPTQIPGKGVEQGGVEAVFDHEDYEDYGNLSKSRSDAVSSK